MPAAYRSVIRNQQRWWPRRSLWWLPATRPSSCAWATRQTRDLARVAAVRKALGDDIAILVDANTGYTVADARKAMPGL